MNVYKQKQKFYIFDILGIQKNAKCAYCKIFFVKISKWLELEHFFHHSIPFYAKRLDSNKWPRHHNKTLKTTYKTLATP